MISVFCLNSCEKDLEEIINIEDIEGLVLMDAHENKYSQNDTAQDTVFYFYKQNNGIERKKVGHWVFSVQ